jgi:anti-sigma factor RsiW
MRDPSRETGEDDLQAFVDDQLALERESLVQQYLRSHPGAAQRVAVYKAQRNQLRALFAGGASEQLPPKLQIDDILKHRRSGGGLDGVPPPPLCWLLVPG